jgi:translation initiation factor IF-3
LGAARSRRWLPTWPRNAPAAVVSFWRGPNIAHEKKNRKNEEIDAPQVRLIGSDGEQVGIVPLEQALETAGEADLDLVEVVPNAEPPVCRIMDYGKFRFEQSKKKNAARKKAKQIQLKEVKFRPGTEEGDYQVKLRNLQKFLEQGDKTKVTLRFRGREMAHRDIGARLLERIRDDLDEIATVEQFPKMEGRQMIMVLAPRKH